MFSLANKIEILSIQQHKSHAGIISYVLEWTDRFNRITTVFVTEGLLKYF